MKIIKPEWPAPENIHAYTSTRLGGLSRSPYDSFNLATHVGESEDIVQRNREMLHTEINLPGEPIWLQQVHGTTVVQAEHHLGKIPTADAVWTNTPNTVCAVLTADCLPLLICNKEGSMVAAIHAGWRGLAAGIIEKTLLEMKESGSQLLAWLGPAIGPEVFEVSDDVRDQFLHYDANTSKAFKPTNTNKWLANIFMLAKHRLNYCGVNSIYGGNHCTYTESDLFYSYRRDQGITGRMATIIWLSI